MALQDTNLLILMAAIPQTFKGTPKEFAETMVKRMKIVSPTGTSLIFTGDTEPTTNVGPWLRDGTKWYVYSEEIKRYIPLDISDSETQWFQTGATTPATGDPALWLRTTNDPTEEDPSLGRGLGWYVFDGENWVPFTGIPESGTTADRPNSPIELQQYYDTTISCLIWWERNAWRTVSGVPGDIKFVAFPTLSGALAQNPGWALFGEGNADIRGRYISMATKNAADEDNTVTPPVGVAARAAFETYGESDGVKIEASAVPYPPSIALWCLVKE